MPRKIPATVVTGFLGAGKTTLIRNLMETAGGRRIALVINEFGDLGVDGGILEGCGIEGCSEDEVVELSNGCICCTVAEDFVPALTRLVEREPAPDHIVIETSGLALPQPLVRAFGWPEVRNRVTVDGVVTVVDGPAVAEGRFAHDARAVEAQRSADAALDHETPLSELFEDQLACADMVVLNKADLLDPAGLEAVSARLSEGLRAGVSVVSAEMGRVPASAALGLGVAAEDDLSARHEIHHHHHHHDDDDADHDDDHDHRHDHDHDHGHDAFDSFVVELPELASPEPLAEAVRSAIAAHGLLRVKGFAAVAGKPMRLVLQAVGPRVDTHFDRPLRPDEPRTTRLVVIGHSGLDRSAIETGLRAAL